MKTQISIIFVLIISTTPIISKTIIKSSRVIGGSNSFAGQFPFTAAVYVQTENTKHFCGSALLNHYWVITAGHCVLNAHQFTLQLGSNTLETPDSNRLLAGSTEFVLHPSFNPDTIENDIGLIQFRTYISYTTYIQPISLPLVDLLNNTIATAVGWGQTNDSEANLSETLQYVSVNVLSNEECRMTYGTAIAETMVCVGGNYNEGACTGDNGSPLIEYASHSYWLVGIASFISGNGCESTDPSGYTRTFPYTTWIKSTIA